MKNLIADQSTIETILVVFLEYVGLHDESRSRVDFLNFMNGKFIIDGEVLWIDGFLVIDLEDFYKVMIKELEKFYYEV